MDALVIGPPAGLATALAAALRRSGRTIFQALPADAADEPRAAWLLAEAGNPALVVVCDAQPHAAAERLLGHGRHVVAVEERRLPTLTADRRPLRRPEARALARAARRRGGVASAVALGRSGRRWSLLGSVPAPLTAERAAALVLRRYVDGTTTLASPARARTAGDESPR